jgi:hypothetical protein
MNVPNQDTIAMLNGDANTWNVWRTNNPEVRLNFRDTDLRRADLTGKNLSKAACFEYFVQLRWPQGFICPRCGAGDAWHTDRGLYRCRRCELEMSVTAGTIMHRTRKPLRLWVRAMWQITDQKFGSNALKILGSGLP